MLSVGSLHSHLSPLSSSLSSPLLSQGQKWGKYIVYPITVLVGAIRIISEIALAALPLIAGGIIIYTLYRFLIDENEVDSSERGFGVDVVDLRDRSVGQVRFPDSSLPLNEESGSESQLRRRRQRGSGSSGSSDRSSHPNLAARKRGGLSSRRVHLDQQAGNDKGVISVGSPQPKSSSNHSYTRVPSMAMITLIFLLIVVSVQGFLALQQENPDENDSIG